MMESVWPAVSMMSGLRELDKAKLLEGKMRMDEAKYILEVAGTPCQDLSGANVSGKGLGGRRSSLFFELKPKLASTLKPSQLQKSIDFWRAWPA